MSLLGSVKMKTFEETEVAAFKARIEAILGKSLEWNIDLASFKDTDGGDFYNNDWFSGLFHRYCFDRVEAVFTRFCAEPSIKAVLAEKINAIEIVQFLQTEVTQGVYKVENGKLIIHAPVIADIGTMEEGIEAYLSDTLNALG